MSFLISPCPLILLCNVSRREQVFPPKLVLIGYRYC